MPTPTHDIAALIQDFANQLIAVADAAAADRLRAALDDALGAPTQRGPGRPKNAPAPQAAAAAAEPSPSRRTPVRTAKLIQARKLQGQYLGALRGLGDRDKARVKKVAKDQGVASALKLAMSLKVAKK